MDGNLILLIFFWIANNAFMYRIAYIRGLSDRAKLTKDVAAPVSDTDGAYWKKMYEELAEEWDYEFKVKVTEGEDAQGETT